MTVVHIIAGSRPPSPPPLVHGVRITFLASASATEPDVIKMGPTLGKGSYGVVYSGQWQGRQVAVKVRWGGTSPCTNFKAWVMHQVETLLIACPHLSAPLPLLPPTPPAPSGHQECEGRTAAA